MFSWFDKRLVRWLLVVMAVSVSIFVIFRMPDDAVKSHQFGIARDFILFSCSTAISWVISSWFAKKESNEKIDTIAERSFEKMAMLTLQIERAKKFLVDTIKLSQSDSEKLNANAGLLAYKHRINGTIATLDQISTSNDTFRADWLGVVSPEMKKALSAKVDALATLPSLVNELSRSQGDINELTTPDSSFGKKIEEVERAVTGAGRLLDELTIKPPKKEKEKVAKITQNFSDNNSELIQSGTIIILVERLTFRATATAKLIPPMAELPEVSVKLTSFPEAAVSENLRYPVGVGVSSDFNIGLHSGVPGLALPFGAYVFEYSAKIASSGQQ